MCQQCKTKPVYEFTNKRKICENCFIRYFQKKVLSTIRRFKMVKKEDIVSYKKGTNFRDVVLEDVLKIFEGKAPIKLIKLSVKNKADKIASPETIDSASYKIIHELIKGYIKKWKDVSPVDCKLIKPLYLFLDEEVVLYAKLKKLKFKEKKIKTDKLSMFIDELERKHPEVKRAVVNSYLELR